MTNLEILFLLGIAGSAPIIMYLAFSRSLIQSAAAAAFLAAAFWGFSLVAMGREGIYGFFVNHSQNLLGTQVWYDLIICLVTALVFVVPRARAAGMNVPLWVIACGLTASLGLLPMVARLFWLEARART